ncbi:MAG: DUF192 domain-containing protein [Zhaonellaceae bacterium]|jgi:uncharacterized membrane protein (UPF0127 family)|nr:DUF192 domain-containing protein [Clostridia bacterium]
MLLNSSKNTVIAKQVKIASTFSQKLRGLMFYKELPPDNCLVIKNCNSIHTCFMRFPLDIIFINKENAVVHLLHGIKPFRCSPVVKEACTVVEIVSGQIIRSHTEVGDTLSFL